MADENDDKCGNATCKCPVEQGKTYCGRHCEKAAEFNQDAAQKVGCHCHHRECGPHSH
jgi:hypothetical protein